MRHRGDRRVALDRHVAAIAERDAAILFHHAYRAAERARYEEVVGEQQQEIVGSRPVDAGVEGGMGTEIFGPEQKLHAGIARRETLEDLAYRHLRQALVDGRLAPGERIVASAVAQSAGVSRIPVMQALRRLESEGFVRINPHKDVVVAGLSPDEFRERFLLMAALEALCLREAAGRITPALIARLDRDWKILKSEVPHLKLSPGEYIRRNVWWTSQPLDEPDNKRFLGDMFDWLGWDRLLFSSDYPHWDFDDPSRVIMFPATDEQRAMFFGGNARAVYGFA